MTKQEYMNWKTSDPFRVVYHYYTTHEKLDHRPLDPQNLMITLQTKGWDLRKIMKEVMDFYDTKFEIIALLDKHGNFIKYV